MRRCVGCSGVVLTAVFVGACGARDGVVLAGGGSDVLGPEDGVLEVPPVAAGQEGTPGAEQAGSGLPSGGGAATGVTPSSAEGAPAGAQMPMIPGAVPSEQPTVEVVPGVTPVGTTPAVPVAMPTTPGAPVPTAAPSNEPPIGVVPVPPAEPDPMQPEDAPLWLALTGGTSRVIDVGGGEGLSLEFELAWDSVNARPASSPDGLSVAANRGGEVVVLDLAALTSTSLSPYVADIVAWGEGGLLLRTTEAELQLVDSPAGMPRVLTTGLAEGAPVNPSISPDWTYLVYSSPTGTDYSTDWLSLVDPEAAGGNVLPSSLSSVLDIKWSVDGSWMAFGVPAADEPGIYLWRSASAEAPIRAIPDDLSYSPNYEFSPDGTRFVVHSNGVLAITALAEPGTTHVLGTGALSPAEWSDSGQYLTYIDNDVGYIVEVSLEGEPQTPAEVPGLRYDCVHAWLDESTFVYSGCGGDPELRLAAVSSGDPPLLAISALGIAPWVSRVRAPGGTCIATWEAGELRVMDVELLTDADVETFGLDNLRLVQWAPDGTGLAWISGAVNAPAVNYVPIRGCQPMAQTRSFGVNAPVTGLFFLAHDD